ncbi:MAG: HIT domain-containing protein [Cyanobacteria bacterium SIG30]|nr:HIT domain-containing protein [Cyanobacteria bacterium SIG30]
MENNCIFCKIANGEIKSDFLYENDNFFVIKDLHPKANTHLLLIPKKHVENLNDFDAVNYGAELISTIQDVTKKLGIESYKTHINTGKDAGQEVFHLHVHILSNVKLT